MPFFIVGVAFPEVLKVGGQVIDCVVRESFESICSDAAFAWGFLVLELVDCLLYFI